MVTTLLGEAMDSEGLAADRYAIYLEGLEAAQNKATASWEGMISASVEGDLVKWYYDTSAGVFDLVTALGGLDNILLIVTPSIIAYMIAVDLADKSNSKILKSIGKVDDAFGSLLLQTSGLKSAWSGLSGVLKSSPGFWAAVIAVIAKAVISVKEFREETAELNADLAKNWGMAMSDIANSTEGTTAVLRKFTKDVEYLESLSASESLGVNRFELIESGLKDVLEILKTSSSTWEEYERASTKAIEAAGYEIDKNGNLFIQLGNGTRLYADGIELANKSIIDAKTATDGWAGRLDALKPKIADVREEVTTLAESFQSFITAAYESLDSPTEEQERFMGNMIELNRMFSDGALNIEEYFNQVGDGFEEINMSEFFGEDQEGAELFITGAVTNAIAGIQQLTDEFNDPENTEGLAEYSQGLVEWGEMFEKLGDMTANIPGFEDVQDSMGGLVEGMDSLSQANEAMVWSQQLLMELENESLRFSTVTFNEKMGMYAEVLAQSGQVYTDTMGNVLGSQQEIYAYMVKDSGNAQLLMEQVANQSGNSINKMKFAVGKMLVDMGNAISNFDATISFTAKPQGMMEIVQQGSWLANQINNGMGIGIPSFTYEVGGDMGELPDDGGDSGFGIEAFGSGGAEDEMSQLEDTVGSLSNAFRELGESSGKSADKIKEDAHSINKLLDMVVAKLKQEAKARKDSLKQQLKDYKKIIDARKKSLKLAREEHDYQEKLEDNQSDMARIQGELEELRLDDSEEAAAKRRALEEEAKELQDEIDEDSFDREIELQGDTLDAEYDSFKDYIDSQIAAIDDYLSKPGLIVSQALAMIETQGEDLYKSLIEYNSIYGSGITNDVTSAWEDAMAALEEYGGLLSEITGNGGSPFAPEFSPSPNANSNSGSGGGGGGNQPLLDSIFNQPEFESNSGNNGLSIDGGLMNFNVAGNLDTAVLPDIDRIANATIAKLNDILGMRGKVRQAQQFAS